MDVSMQLRELAHAVGEDFAQHAPDDAARLVGRARRSRMVWTTGVGTATAGVAASLAFGGPALASAFANGSHVEPGASTSSSVTSAPTIDATDRGAPASAQPSPTPSPSAGTIDMTGGAVSSGDDDSDDAFDDDSGDRVGDDSGQSHEESGDDSRGDSRDDSGHDASDDRGGDDD